MEELCTPIENLGPVALTSANVATQKLDTLEHVFSQKVWVYIFNHFDINGPQSHRIR